MSKRNLLKPSIVITLIFWIFAAITNARHIITAEDQQQVPHHITYNLHHKDNHLVNNPQHHYSHSTVDHTEKRAVSMQEDSADDSIRSNDVNNGYDEYPIVTPKRAAMLLDRIMVALHHALEDSEDGTGRKINDVYRDGRYGEVAKAGAHGGKSLYHAASAGKTAMRPYGGHKVQQLSGNDEIMDGTEYDDITEKILDDRSAGNEDEEDVEARDNTMDLQRRGHDASTGPGIGKGRVYWRCYFNAVTCF